jgi:hypothetical protein
MRLSRGVPFFAAILMGLASPGVHRSQHLGGKGHSAARGPHYPQARGR